MNLLCHQHVDLKTSECKSTLYKQKVFRNYTEIRVLIKASQFIYLFGVLRLFQHYAGHITMGSWKGRGNQYIQFVRVVYCKLPTNGKQLPAFPLEAVPGTEPRPQRWEARVLPLCHHGLVKSRIIIIIKHWKQSN